MAAAFSFATLAILEEAGPETIAAPGAVRDKMLVVIP
jgi:hypothetical protein